MYFHFHSTCVWGAWKGRDKSHLYRLFLFALYAFSCKTEWIAKKICPPTRLCLPLAMTHCHCNAILLLPWVNQMNRHLLHSLMQPILHWAILSYQQNQVLHLTGWIQLIKHMGLLARHTCSVIIKTLLFRYAKHIIYHLLLEQVVVEVICHWL